MYLYFIFFRIDIVSFFFSAEFSNIVIQDVNKSSISFIVFSITVLLFSILARSRTLLSNDSSFCPQLLILSIYPLSLSGSLRWCFASST